MVKKAQAKIQQMAFMLIAVTIFFVLAGLFALFIVFSSLRSSAGNLQEKSAFLLVSRLANSPEFSCGESYGGTRTDCVDSDKLFALSLFDSTEYSGFWGFSRVEIEKISPKYNETCDKSNYPSCNKIVITNSSSGGTSASNFVSICRKERIGTQIQDICELGRLNVFYKN